MQKGGPSFLNLVVINSGGDFVFWTRLAGMVKRIDYLDWISDRIQDYFPEEHDGCGIWTESRKCLS